LNNFVAKVPRGSLTSMRTAAVNTASYKCADKSESGLVGKRIGNPQPTPKVAQLIITLPCNQIYMMRESEAENQKRV